MRYILRRFHTPTLLWPHDSLTPFYIIYYMYIISVWYGQGYVDGKQSYSSPLTPIGQCSTISALCFTFYIIDCAIKFVVD